MLPFPLLESRRHVLLHKIQASMHRHHCCPAAQQARTRYVAHHSTVTKVCLSGQAVLLPAGPGVTRTDLALRGTGLLPGPPRSATSVKATGRTALLTCTQQVDGAGESAVTSIE